jgi:hypothetical protein
LARDINQKLANSLRKNRGCYAVGVLARIGESSPSIHLNILHTHSRQQVFFPLEKATSFFEWVMAIQKKGRQAGGLFGVGI